MGRGGDVARLESLEVVLVGKLLLWDKNIRLYSETIGHTFIKVYLIKKRANLNNFQGIC